MDWRLDDGFAHVILDGKITARDRLREAVGWGRLDEHLAEQGLAGALFTVWTKAPSSGALG